MFRDEYSSEFFKTFGAHLEVLIRRGTLSVNPELTVQEFNSFQTIYIAKRQPLAGIYLVTLSKDNYWMEWKAGEEAGITS